MTAHHVPKDVLTALRQVQDWPALPDARRAAAHRLHARLTRPVRVAILGPMADVGQFLHAGLRQSGGLTLDALSLAVVSDQMVFDEVDIALWGTFIFAAEEATLWNAAPDALKDRSFLVVVVPEERGSADVLADVTARAGDQFDAVLSVPMQGNPAPMRRLADRLWARVSDGQQADIDSARMLIDLCGGCDQKTAGPPVPPPAVDRQAAASPLVAAEHVLRDHAADLARGELKDDTASITALLRSCEAAAEALCDALDGADPPLLADAMQAYDDIVLMGLESSIASATDAVTTLLQLRKDLQIELAS